MIDPKRKHFIAIAALEKELKAIIQTDPKNFSKKNRYHEILYQIRYHKDKIGGYDKMIKNGVKF